MKPEISLSTQHAADTVVCSHCQRELSRASFYVNKKTQRVDKCCKECRKAMSRQHYCSNKKVMGAALPQRPSYPVITEIRDREIRLQLIREALRKVRLSIEQKQEKKRKLEEGTLFPETQKTINKKKSLTD